MMQTSFFATRTELDEALPQPFLRSMQIIHIALPLGPVLFALAAVTMDFSIGGIPPRFPDFEMMNVLSAIHVVFVLAALVASEAAYRWFTDVRRISPSPTDTSARFASTILGRFRTASMVRLILLEGVAMFGLMVCVLGLTRGVLDVEPVYWLNIGSTALLVAIAAWKFPTRERVISTVQQMCSLR